MGYYSDVTLILRADAAAKLQKALTDGIADGDENASEAKEFIDGAGFVRRASDGSALYQWTCIRWYTDFPKVRFIEHFLQGISNRSYYFIRIGEDYDDIEFAGAYDCEPFGICLERYVSVTAVEGIDAAAVSAA